MNWERANKTAVWITITGGIIAAGLFGKHLLEGLDGAVVKIEAFDEREEKGDAAWLEKELARFDRLERQMDTLENDHKAILHSLGKHEGVHSVLE